MTAQAQFAYTTNNDAITITGYTGSGGMVNIPGMIDGLAVTDIGTNAFQGSALTSVVIPESVTTIGSAAFEGCFYMTNLTISPGVIDIGSNAFASTDLFSLTIPDSVTNIGDYAFYDCGLTNLVLESGLVSIGAYAFCPTLGNGSGLPTIAIPDSVTNIGTGAFSECSGLTAINVASNNPAYTTLNGVLFNKTLTTLLQYPGGLGGSYAVPDSVLTIGATAFEDCSVTSVTLPLGLVDIGSNAFYGCTSLGSLTVPDSVTNIGDYAFYDCYSLTNVVLDSGLVSIGAYVFSGTDVNASYGGLPWQGCPITSIIIPNSVATIGDFTFSFCNLTNIVIGSGLTNIGEGAFGGCPLTEIDVVPGNPDYTTLAGVLFNHDQSTLVEFPCGLGGSYTIPNSVTNIGDYAFYDCTSLTNVVLDNNLISIGACAFSGPVFSMGPGAGPDFSLTCPLTSITVPANVTTIGAFAFSGSQSLTSAYFLGNAPDADWTVFSTGGPLIGGEGPVSAYYLPGTTGWAEFFARVPTALWTLPYPLVLNGSFGVLNNQFGFTISWATNVPVVVEASTDLSSRVWTPVATNTLTGGVSYFSDPQWTNYPARFYRIRSQ